MRITAPMPFRGAHRHRIDVAAAVIVYFSRKRWRRLGDVDISPLIFCLIYHSM
jgi:hypothetical protein